MPMTGTGLVASRRLVYHPFALTCADNGTRPRYGLGSAEITCLVCVYLIRLLAS